MVSQWWSVVLTVIGVVGLIFTMRKSVAGPAIGTAVQTLWIAYALASGQLAFIASALAYGAVNLYGVRRWIRERRRAVAR